MNPPIRAIRFYHQGRIVEADAPPTRTVLDWLRDERRLTGTKEGCAEGDCGACTVVVGSLAADGTLALEPANACIRFLPSLDGRALFTVEDVSRLDPGGALHPVQQAMVECHGSQCGFCTPGIVMSLWAGYERRGGAKPTRQELADELAGNLCRCTGYRPILDAGERACEAPPLRLDAAPVLAALRELAADAPLARPGWHAPKTLDELAALREAKPDARLLAGSTDLGLWVTKQFRDLGEIVHLGAVPELRRIEEADGAEGRVLRIGAAASLEDAWAALAARAPALREVWLRFASPPIRHAGTMGGNVANGSPIGDSAPVLMAAGARLVLRRGAALRTLPLDGFYTGYQRNRLERGEFVQAIELPLPLPATLRAYKISKRFDSDISAVLAALAVDLDAGGVVRSARFAWGGMAATVARAARAEAAVTGRPWDEATLAAAQAALEQDFQPLSDLRASAGHRRRVARNLLRRYWLETRPADPLPAAALSVFAREEHA